MAGDSEDFGRDSRRRCRRQEEAIPTEEGGQKRLQRQRTTAAAKVFSSTWCPSQCRWAACRSCRVSQSHFAWVCFFCKFWGRSHSNLFDSRTPLGNFCRHSMHLHMMRDSHYPSKQLWPCPIPDKLVPMAPISSGRRRSRFNLRAVVREHLRAFVAACNWLTTGRNKFVPSDSRLPPSQAQSRMLADLEQSLPLLLFYRLSPGPNKHLSGTTVALRNQMDPYCRAVPILMETMKRTPTLQFLMELWLQNRNVPAMALAFPCLLTCCKTVWL